MTRRELNLAIFEGTAEGVLWQPRLETWIRHHMTCGTMPDRFRGMSHLEIYDELRCSIRYGAAAGVERVPIREDVVRITEEHPSHTIQRVRTPVGETATVFRDVWEGERRVSHRIEGFPVKTVADLRVFTWLAERERYRSNVEAVSALVDEVCGLAD